MVDRSRMIDAAIDHEAGLDGNDGVPAFLGLEWGKDS